MPQYGYHQVGSAPFKTDQALSVIGKSGSHSCWCKKITACSTARSFRKVLFHTRIYFCNVSPIVAVKLSGYVFIVESPVDKRTRLEGACKITHGIAESISKGLVYWRLGLGYREALMNPPHGLGRIPLSGERQLLLQ
ncbi:hypothetical protein CPSG_03885 [Coccidioides posadasii str. Silveira]|uniref:Uncharacterized protein n=1 Tax=Coccidioides posadasii (strain RMSCC 757 / Silveira) TaxID=443226 RepID=E9D2T7_COCPS|nr:hypothetical protein CPSG_03885 [Coccidioides posadasii str. Silveira]